MNKLKTMVIVLVAGIFLTANDSRGQLGGPGKQVVNTVGLENALDRAADENKLVLAVVGRNSCSVYRGVNNSIKRSRTARASYVVHNIDIDRSREWRMLAPEGEFALPMLVVIHPSEDIGMVARSFGNHSPGTLEAKLKSYVKKYL